MSPLTSLHRRLAALRQRRQFLRWCLAWTALATAVLWSLAVLFVIDLGFSLRVPQRLAVMVLGGGAIFWAIRRFTIPWLGIKETETDVALFVERQHGIDSDLVAALQFDKIEAERWGSWDLRSAVVARMAEASQKLDIHRGMDYLPLSRRLKVLGVSLAVAMVVTALYPRYIAVFFSRLMLSERHYPTATNLEIVAINDNPVWKWNPSSARPHDIRSAKGRPVRFLVEASGAIPETGGIECRSLLHGTVRQLELRQLAADELLGDAIPAELRRTTVDAHAANHGFFVADMPHLVEGFAHTIRLGDAWTDPAEIQMIEPPVVEMSVHVIPPEYASSAANASQSPRHISVLEGSRVVVALQSLNQKELKSASIQIEAGGEVRGYALAKHPSNSWEWSVPDGTPLSNVVRELRYEIQVLDQDGLGLEFPLHGFVQLRTDRPPTAMASVVHRVVLPDAKPVIEYRLNDDYGVASAVLQTQIERSRTGDATDKAPDEKLEWKVPLDPLPVVGQNLPYRGKFSLDLSRFKLVKGDQLKLTMVVVDYRGQNTGKSQSSDPILLEISDEAGVLAAITEADERSEKRLSDMIKQQLGVGGKK